MATNEVETLARLSQHFVSRSEASSDRELEYPWQRFNIRATVVPATFSVAAEGEIERDDVVLPWHSQNTFERSVRSVKKWKQDVDVADSTSPFHVTSQELASSSFENILAYLKYGLNRENGGRLAERLEELRADLSEEDEGLPGLSIASVLGLLRFFENNPEVRDPALVVSGKGAVRAEWHRSWTEHFVVEFLTDTLTRFVVITKNATTNDVEHLSGRCSVESVMDRATPFGVRTWVVRG